MQKLPFEAAPYPTMPEFFGSARSFLVAVIFRFFPPSCANSEKFTTSFFQSFGTSQTMKPSLLPPASMFLKMLR